jgi:hypothetical protein
MILTVIGFPPSGSGGKIVHKYKINSYIHGEKQYTQNNTKTQNTQNRKQNVQNKKANTSN